MLIELLRKAADGAPDREVVATHAGSLGYGRCVARAEALALGLRRRSIERFACRVDDVGELIALLCAASAVGSEPCVYPDRLDDEETREFAATFGHDVVLADADLDELAEGDGELPPPPDSAPVLILTTGTTGRPKGVRHDWRRLVASVRHPDDHPGARWLLAYNLNQFAGIQILLHVLASGATLVAGLTRQPRDAVPALRDLGVTHVSATPTFWRLLLARLGDEADALRIEQITLGGEAVPEPLLEALAARFPGVRISQVYAASEFGSAVSVRDGRSGLPLSVLERGDAAEVQFRIVDGELHARSRVGMLGYHGERDADDGWRPTGDLVEVRDDRIHFVGRTSEIINVGGVKVHPLPVEEAVGGVDGVEIAHAYGRSNPVAGQIVAVDVVPRDDADPDELKARIRAACDALPPAARPRSIRLVDDLEVRDNKIARREQAGR